MFSIFKQKMREQILAIAPLMVPFSVGNLVFSIIVLMFSGNTMFYATVIAIANLGITTAIILVGMAIAVTISTIILKYGNTIQSWFKRQKSPTDMFNDVIANNKVTVDEPEAINESDSSNLELDPEYN